MKKKYIFITFAIFGIGGTQVYIRNKKRFLEENGWDVVVLTSELQGDNEILVSDLSPYRDNIFPEIMNNPNLYMKKTRNVILDKMCSIIKEVPDGSIIETNFIQATFWGELIAQRLHIRNFIFLIQEEYRLKINAYLKFFKHKMDRGEFAVNIPYAINQLFDGFCKHPDGETLSLRPICQNVTADCFSDIPEKLPHADYVIASIGRINKQFVNHMARDLTDYARHYPDKTFLLLMIGSSPNSADYDTLKAITSDAANLMLYITGSLFPIPIVLLRVADVFISSAGATVTSADEGFITISIDANDFKPIGILYYTTENTLLRGQSTEITPLSDLLDEILIKKKYRHSGISRSDIEDEIKNEFTKHLFFLSNADVKLEYYNIKKIHPSLGLRVLWLKKYIRRNLIKK